MRPLIDKENALPADSDYPFGRTKDKTPTENGTKLNEEMFGDAMQFFEKMMDESGITPNALPDNAYSGFQLFQAFKRIINNQQYKEFYSELYTTTGDFLTSNGMGALSGSSRMIRLGNKIDIDFFIEFTKSGTGGFGFVLELDDNFKIDYPYFTSIGIINYSSTTIPSTHGNGAVTIDEDTGNIVSVNGLDTNIPDTSTVNYWFRISGIALNDITHPTDY